MATSSCQGVDGDSSCSRIRTMTEKGLMYRKDQLNARRIRLWKDVEAKMQQINDLLKVSFDPDISIVEYERSDFNNLLSEFDELSSEYKELLDPVELESFNVEYQTSMTSVTSFKTELYYWLQSHKPNECPKAMSVKSCSSAGKSSKCSSAASEKVMQKMAKLAALQTQKSFVDKEANLQRQRVAADLEAKQLQLDRDMAVTRAELSVYEQFSSGESNTAAADFQPVTSQTLTSTDYPPGFYSQQSVSGSQSFDISLANPSVNTVFNPCIPPPVMPMAYSKSLRPPIMSTTVDYPQPVTAVGNAQLLPPNPVTVTRNDSDCNYVHSVPQLCSQNFSNVCHPGFNVGSDNLASLSEVLNRSQLPKLELSVFAGDPLEFQQWLVSFEKIIEDATVDPSRRLHYLMQYTSGNAKVLVAGHALNQTEAGYNAAKAELVKEFGDPYILARAYLKRIEAWKNIPANDTYSLQIFSTFLKNCRGSMPSLKHLQQLNTDLYLQKIVAKLSVPLQTRWRNVVDHLVQNNKDINFCELVEFVEQEARIARHPVFSADALQQAEAKGKPGMQSTAVKGNLSAKHKAILAATSTAEDNSMTAVQCATAATAEPARKQSRSCPKCTGSHDLDDCKTYLNQSVEDRRKFLMTNHLCFGCYGRTSRNHDVRSCRRRRKCQICGKSHPTGLHGWRPTHQLQREEDSVPVPAQSDETQVKSVQSCATSASTESVAMNIVMVQLYKNCDPAVCVKVYAALDSMSTACFISRDVWMQLGSPGEPTDITIKTVTGESRQSTTVVSNLCISSVFSDKMVRLPKVYTQDMLPVSVDEVPSHETLKRYPHFSHLISEMPDRDDTIPVGLIIGANCPKALQPQLVIPSIDNGPFAIKTVLGWCLSGPLDDNLCLGNILCNRIQVSDGGTCVQDSGVKEMLQRMYESDFTESATHQLGKLSVNHTFTRDHALSQEDKKFLSIMESEVQFIDGHYQLPLPFRHPNVPLPNNRSQAVQRALGLKKRFLMDPKFHADYSGFMRDIICKGYAKPVSVIDSEDECRKNKLWYIPHHGVYHPQKPGKIRVVFDCSCKYLGVSLNNALLQGPDLTNSLIGVLIRFRQEPIAIIGDIEAMFYQVKVPDTQLDYLRFVWWPDGNLNADLKEYQMTVHLFGAVSSPSCANFALRKTASDNESEFGTFAADTLRNNFYVDDMLKSVPDTATAGALITAVQQMCASGGFHLTKLVTNSREVLATIPVSDRAKNVMSMDLSQSVLPVERALGVHWCIENDTLGFRITLKDKPLTLRGILSTISSIYDPLGLASPFLLKGRKLFQHLCVIKQLDWDQQIEGEEYSVWEQWRAHLPLLESIEVQRCFKPPEFGHVVSAELHHFSDASHVGYGQCSYLRLVDVNNEVSCSLVIGKSRVSPVKPITIPRLELTAATVAAKVGRMLETEMHDMNVESFYWTDSKAVLGYISNEARKFHVFVANRVQLIRDISNIDTWNYISTDMNPADDASRGLDCRSVVNSHRWFRGPSFLWEVKDHWPCQTVMKSMLAESDPEVRKQAVICTLQVCDSDTNIIDRIMNYSSSWYKLKKAVAWILVIIKQLFSRIKKLQLRNITEGLTVEELQFAEVAILKYVQLCSFPEEIAALVNGRTIKKSSDLYRLSPIMSSDGLLCIEGRLRNSSVSLSSRHQIILPKSHHVTMLVIRYFHHQSGHAGKEFVLSLIREKFWIISARQAVRHVLKNCITCRKYYGKPLVQKMADLPPQRVTSDQPPFTFVGLDYFGPFLIKYGRSQVKRYGCIFTCLTTRAIHIEVAHSLEADSFINVLQRFICRRGKPLEILSDNGTNFVGGERELREAIRKWNESKVPEFMRQKEIHWKFNPPTASHMGGAWERQIRTIRKILSALMNQQQLTDDALHTLFCLVENIVNNRPMTAVSDDPTDLEPLTPNHLLQLRSGPSLPPGDFVKQDLYCRRRWRQVQYLADIFWKRWTKEYLPTLQLRGKWQQTQSNIQMNSVVLVIDDSLPRNCWLLGRVIKTFPGSDGLVRAVEIKTKNGVFVRPIHKLCLLELAHDN